MNEQTELRAGLIAAYGEGELLSQLDALVTENERLLILEKSILKKAEMLRHNFWDVSEEVGAAGEIHAGITSLWMDMEGIAEQRDQFQEGLARLAGKTTCY